MKKPYSKLLPTISLISLALLVALAPFAVAIEIVISGSPVETGSGSSLKARFSNVATVDGTDIDLFGEVLSQTSTKTNKFRAVGDDFKFQIQDGEDGEDRSATVKWTFFESGTTTPVVVEGLSLTVDDLDDYAGRTESLETDDALSYTVNDPTNVVTSFTGGTTSAAGGDQQDSGDPESAITLYFMTGSSFVITYRSVFRWDGNAAFIHDGDGDFIFSNPLARLFYTFHFTNDEEIAVPVNFFNHLPAGLAWDPDFIPQASDLLTGVNPVFSNDNRDASITGLVLHPGASHLTLCTLGTTITGEITAQATILPLQPGSDPLYSNATINLP